MKKMKKLVATLVCLVMAIATLSACTSTGNTKPTEEPTAKPTEVVSPTENPTDTPTQEPTVPTDPTDEVPVTTEPTTVESEGELIPLWNPVVEATGLTIQQVFEQNPIDQWFVPGSYDTTIGMYFQPTPTDRMVNGRELYQWRKPWNAETVTLIDTGTGNTVEAEFYFFKYDDGSSLSYIEAGGSSESLTFLPLWYDSGEHMLIGFWKNAGVWNLVKLKLFNGSVDFLPIDDTSVYGF